MFLKIFFIFIFVFNQDKQVFFQLDCFFIFGIYRNMNLRLGWQDQLEVLMFIVNIFS